MAGDTRGLRAAERSAWRSTLTRRRRRHTLAANVVAMEEAIAIGERPEPLTADDVLAIHRTLMAGEPERVRPGQFRREQNWVGGRLNTPLDARFIPPPEDAVDRFVADLLAFLARDDVPPVAQAAIGHAQFETIHPFVEGNGRIGRCLIHVVLRRTGLARGSCLQCQSFSLLGRAAMSTAWSPSASVASRPGARRSPAPASARPACR